MVSLIDLDYENEDLIRINCGEGDKHSLLSQNNLHSSGKCVLWEYTAGELILSEVRSAWSKVSYSILSATYNPTNGVIF